MEVADIYKFVGCDLKETRKKTANHYLHYGTVYVSEPSDIKIKCKIITTSTDTTINPELKEFCNNVNQTSELFINNTNIPEHMTSCCTNFNEPVIIDWDSNKTIEQFTKNIMNRGDESKNCNGDKNYLNQMRNIGSRKLANTKVSKEETLMVTAGIQTIMASSYAAIMPYLYGGILSGSCAISALTRKAIGYEYNKWENTMAITSSVDVTIYNTDCFPMGKEVCTTRETYKILDFTDRKITLQCVGMNIYQQNQELLI